MSHIIEKEPVLQDAQRAAWDEKEITDNPYPAGLDAHFIWEREFQRVSKALNRKKEEVAA